MKNLLALLSIALIVGCTSNSKNPSTLNGIDATVHVLSNQTEWNVGIVEFPYKGHTYIGKSIEGYFYMTHAGHCACNKGAIVDTTKK